LSNGNAEIEFVARNCQAYCLIVLIGHHDGNLLYTSCFVLVLGSCPTLLKFFWEPRPRRSMACRLGQVRSCHVHRAPESPGKCPWQRNR
jgi:hypothetical protein